MTKKAEYYQPGAAIDYTPSSTAVVAGQVVKIGTIPLIAPVAIPADTKGVLATEGVFKVDKKNDVFAAGDAVYWNTTANPVSGGAGTGAATNSTGDFMGQAVEAATNNSTTVKVKLSAYKVTQTLGGAVTAASVTGNGSDLALTGAAGTNNSNAGKTVTVVGGAGFPTSAGAGGATSLKGGNGANNGGAGGAVSIVGGAAKGANAAGGAVSIDGGAKNGSGADGAITIGGTNAASITLGKMPRVPVAAVTAAGNAANNAAALAEGYSVVTCDDNTKGVILPTAVAGAQCVIINRNAAYKVQLYPPLTKSLNGSTNNATELAANTLTHCVATDANTWIAG
jgi:predicted RecA/RadA family phage recombinase